MTALAPSAHAKLSPSAAHRVLRCPASLSLEAGFANTSSEFADEGTAAHELAAKALTDNRDADSYIGDVIEVGERSFTIDDDMAAAVQVYLDRVREFADGGELFVEQRVAFGCAIGQPDDIAFGTSDAVVIRGSEICVIDLKYGRGVKVDAERNEQLQLYALGAVEAFGLAYDFDHVRMVIVQPRIGALSEWDCSIAELRGFANEASTAYASALTGVGGLIPGDKQCKFCRAKAECPALTAQVADAVVGDFADLTEDSIKAATADLDKVFSLSLGRRMALVDLIEGWCKAVRARAESELLAGRAVDGFKLVEGRRGSRAWSDKAAAEAMLKSMRMRVDEMYDLSLISPTTAEKRLADAPRRWAKVQGLITQAPGKPSVAPATDKRPALIPTDDFTNLDSEPLA